MIRIAHKREEGLLKNLPAEVAVKALEIEQAQSFHPRNATCYLVFFIKLGSDKMGNKVHHEHDVGYKHIFSHKGTFLEFLRSFTKKEWAKLIKEEDLI